MAKPFSPFPWSWSMLNDYKTCPKRFYEMRVMKSVKEDESQHLIWGNEVHKAMELRISMAVPLPANMQHWEHIAAAFANAPGTKYTEQRTAVDHEFQACDFWADNCWNRGLDDLLIINGTKAIDLDWKTGKPTKFSAQLSTSAARVFARHPEVEEITTVYAWLATGTYTKAKFVRSQVAGIWEEVMEDVQQMVWSAQNNAWPAKPSGLCKPSKKPGSTYGGCPVTNCPHSGRYVRGT